MVGDSSLYVRRVGERHKIVRQTDSGFGLEAWADPGDPLRPDPSLPVRPLPHDLCHGWDLPWWLLAPSTRQRLAEWVLKKNKTPIYAVYKRPTSKQGTHTDWKWRAGKKIFHAYRNQKKAGVAILISDKIDFEIKAVKRDKKGHYIRIKGSIQEDITIINIYAPNIGALQYVRQMLTSMKGKINSNTK